MGKGDKHSQKRDYMKNYVGSKAQREAEKAKRNRNKKMNIELKPIQEILKEDFLKLAKIKSLIENWDSKQEHDACHYYPEIFREIAEICGAFLKNQHGLPPREEFHKGCNKYTNEVYNTENCVKCIDCGLPYTSLGCDLVLPDQQWKTLCPEDRILCANCICQRAKKVGSTVIMAWLDSVRYIAPEAVEDVKNWIYGDGSTTPQREADIKTILGDLYDP